MRRLTYPTPPEPGTILGPNALGEHLVVRGPDPDQPNAVKVGYATVDDITAALQREPRSLAEHNLNHATRVAAIAAQAGR